MPDENRADDSSKQQILAGLLIAGFTVVVVGLFLFLRGRPSPYLPRPEDRMTPENRIAVELWQRLQKQPDRELKRLLKPPVKP